MKTTIAHQLSTSIQDIRSYLSTSLTLLRTTHLKLGCQPQLLPPLLHCDLALHHHEEQCVLVGTAHALGAVPPDHQPGDVGLLNGHGTRPQRPNLHLRTNPLHSHSHITPPRPRGRDLHRSAPFLHSVPLNGMLHTAPSQPGPTQDVTVVLVEEVEPNELKQDQTQTSIISAITSGQPARSNPAG
jgi:hypothetical protein